MKPSRLPLFALLLLLACSKTSDDPAVPERPCKIKSSSASQSNPSNEMTSNMAYEYDANGAPTSWTTSYKYRTLGQASPFIIESTASNTYAYDANGFLTAHTYASRNRNEIGTQVTTTQNTTQYTYRYTDGKLTEMDQVTTSTAANGTTSSSRGTTRYETNAQGQLTKSAYTYPDGTQFVSSYENGKLKSQEWLYANGTRLIPNVSINAQGFITRSATTDSQGNAIEQRYEYDANGNQTKSESYLRGQLQGVSEVQYGTQANRTAESFPRFKGHPVIPGLYGSNAQHPTASVFSYRNPSSGALVKGSEGQYTYQFNAKGLVTSQTLETTSYAYGVSNGATTITPTKSTQTTTYTYLDCN